MKKQKFDTEICVRREKDCYGSDFLTVVGNPRKPHLIDADNGDAVAIYGLLRVETYRTNPRLEK